MSFGFPTEPIREPLDEITVATRGLRANIRKYARDHPEKLCDSANDTLRLGLGDIRDENDLFDKVNLHHMVYIITSMDRRKYATTEDMYQLSYAFLQSNDYIRMFAGIPEAMQVLVKEFTGHDTKRQVSAAECFCNLSLGDESVCEIIVKKAGSYLITYLDSTVERLTRTSLWTLANIIATGGRGAQTLMYMELVPKLWYLYTAEDEAIKKDYRLDAAICLQLISLRSKQLLRAVDLKYLRQNMRLKNPFCTGGEYHLQILFHSEIMCYIKTDDNGWVVNKGDVKYLINYAIHNLYNTSDFVENASRLRILYAIRFLSDLLVMHPKAFKWFLSITVVDWQTNVVHEFNRLFAYRNPALTKETLWLVSNFVEQQKTSGKFLQFPELLHKLNVPRKPFLRYNPAPVIQINVVATL